MALPKEPRQKMINIMYLVLTAILALNVSAEVINAFRTVDHSLTTSNENITKANKTLYESLAEKLKDAESAEKAKKWTPLAEQVHKASDELMTYIDGLKKDLKDGSGLRMVEKDGKMVEDYKLDGLDASTRIFETEGKGKEFEAKLVAYKNAILALDPDIKKAFETSLPIDVTPPPSQEGHAKDFTASYFHMTPTIAALTMLSKFQNNVKNAENQVVTYCHSQIGAVKVVFNKFEPIIAASSTYLMPNDEFSISAGVGAFNTASSPKVYFNGVPSAMDENGVGTYKNKVSSSGSVRVEVEYTKPDGTRTKTEPKVITYVVGQSSSATVSLDKMDVFYIGLENPITIASPTGMDKTSVSGTGCTINRTGSKATVTVTTPGTCTITVSPQGNTPFTHTYRIKKIPEPVFKVGSGKPRMPSVEFKNQTACRADMGSEFIYDVKYNVVSATVYFSGAGFPNVATTTITGNNLSGLASYFSRCVPGTSITFDNVKVQGPDGVKIIEGKTFSLF